MNTAPATQPVTINAGDLVIAGYSFDVFHALRDVIGADAADRLASAKNLDEVANDLYGCRYLELNDGMKNSVDMEVEGRALDSTPGGES